MKMKVNMLAFFRKDKISETINLKERDLF
jgi:hypothetical protein